MKKTLVLVFAALAFSHLPLQAGSVETRFVADPETKKTPLDVIRFEGGFVFESTLSHEDGQDFGGQDAFEVEFEYSHRFQLHGNWYLRTGVVYNRFDFSGTRGAPVPDHLQSVAAVLSIDYMVGADRGAFLEVQPGFYGEDDYGKDTFDVQITLGRAWVLKRDKLFLFTGVNAAFLRGQLPVLPLIGVVWCISDKWLLYAVPPEPRLVYMPNKKLDLWIGGQLTGGSFRTDRDDSVVPQKLSQAQVDYSDYRAGVGFVWHAADSVDLDFGAGYSIQRRFNFDRAGEDFTTEPAPFLRARLKAEF